MSPSRFTSVLLGLVAGLLLTVAIGIAAPKRSLGTPVEKTIDGATLVAPNVKSSATRRYRLVWANDPTSTATIAWEQIAGTPATVRYGTTDFGRDATKYPKNKSVDRQTDYRGMKNCFARVEGLKPDTTYYFVIEDKSGVSPRFFFRTAPTTAQPFTFCAGGDSRNNRKPRQNGNILVAKLRPLFVAFTGDMINSDKDSEWQEWLDDWELTTSSDGRITPILPHRGNHETSNRTIDELFDTGADNYYSLGFGGNLMRFYILNSEMNAGGAQREWLEADLREHSTKVRHLCVGYHKPMRPVVAQKREGTDEYENWAQVFYDYGIDLSFESDSHAMKRTKPIKPSTASGSDEGFITALNDDNATVYVGEGCWGAPLRAAKDTKSWTIAAGSFYGFDWVQVLPDRMDLRTVIIDDTAPSIESVSDSNPLTPPKNLKFWQPSSGEVLTIPGDGDDQAK